MARSSYYAWEAGEQARVARKREDLALVHKITVIHVASKGTYGVPRYMPSSAAKGARSTASASSD